MTTQPCPHCPTLRAEADQLRATVSILERIIAAAQRECMRLTSEAAQTQASHVSRGVWAHAEGKRNAAAEVLRKLRN